MIWKEDPGAGAGEKPERGGNLTTAERKQMSTKRKEEASEMTRGLR